MSEKEKKGSDRHGADKNLAARLLRCVRAWIHLWGGKRVWRKTKGTKEQKEEKRRTSGGIKVGYPMKDDAVQEQRRGVDLHGAAQEAVEDPNVPAVKAGRRVSIISPAQLGCSALEESWKLHFPSRVKVQDVAVFVALGQDTGQSTTVIKSNCLVFVSWSSEAFQNVIVHFGWRCSLSVNKVYMRSQSALLCVCVCDCSAGDDAAA